MTPLGGALLTCVGVYLVWYWISAMGAPLASNPVERVVNTVQAHVASFVETEATIVGAVIGALVVVSVLVAGFADVRAPWRAIVASRRAGGAEETAPDPRAIVAQYSDTTR